MKSFKFKFKVALIGIAVFLLTLYGFARYWIAGPLTAVYVAPPVLTAEQLKNLPTDLQAHVKKLSIDFFPRDHRNIKNLDLTADYIRAEFSKTSAKVSIQPFKVDGFSYQNIIASFDPDSDELNTERIVIGAHYDAFDMLPAADDNASGVAGLLELAKLLDGAKLKRRVELVAYTLEEPPHFRTKNMGSYIHAQSLKNDKARVKVMISLECIGYFADAPNTQDFPVPGLELLYPNKGNFIAIVGRMDDRAPAATMKRAMHWMLQKMPLDARTITAPSFVHGIDFSDQLNYWAIGVPALMVTDTAFFRNKAYHTPQDTFDRLDYQRMSQVVQGVYAAVIALDDE